VAAGVALRIDALHREAGQVLHLFSLKGRKAQDDSGASALRTRHQKNSELPLAAKTTRGKNPGETQRKNAQVGPSQENAQDRHT